MDLCRKGALIFHYKTDRIYKNVSVSLFEIIQNDKKEIKEKG